MHWIQIGFNWIHWIQTSRRFIAITPEQFSRFCCAWWYILAPTIPRFKPLLFFLRVFLKEKVFSQKHNTISDLKNAFEREVASITPSMLSKVQVSFEKCLQLCVTLWKLSVITFNFVSSFLCVTEYISLPSYSKLGQKTHCYVVKAS